MKLFALLGLTTVTFLLLTLEPTMDRHKRSDVNFALSLQTQITFDQYNNSFQVNLWYRYASYIARSRNLTNCYVCTRMPLAARNPYVIPRPLMNDSVLFPHVLPSAVSPLPLNQTVGNKLPAPVDVSTISYDGLLTTNISGDKPVYGPLHVPPQNKFVCYENHVPLLQQKPTHMGSVAKFHCKVTYVPCTVRSDGSLNSSEAPSGTTCKPYFTVPDAMGTHPWSDVVWMCGTNAFLNLPPGWSGRCAAVIPSDHSYIVASDVLTVLNSRTRRSFQRHDPVWGTDVPPDHKLWSDGQKVVLSLFPWLGVGKVMLRVETLDYRLGSFVNLSLKALTGVREEMRALRLMELQDRLVLDQLTASAGGVCAIVGAACCSFIPANDADGGMIHQAIANLTALRDAIEGDHVAKGDFLAWFTSGPWQKVLLKILTPVFIVLLLFCLFTSCILPCLRDMVARLVSTQVSTQLFLMSPAAKYEPVPTAPLMPDPNEYSDI